MMNLECFNIKNLVVGIDHEFKFHDGDIYYCDDYVVSFSEVPVHGDIFPSFKDKKGNEEIYNWLWQQFSSDEYCGFNYAVEYLLGKVKIEYENPYKNQDDYKYKFIQVNIERGNENEIN